MGSGGQIINRIPHQPNPQLRQRIEEKNKLLRQLAASATAATAAVFGGSSAGAAAAAAVDLSDVMQRWDGFTAALQQFDAHLESQRGRLQEQLARRLEQFAGDVTGFGSRWQALRPKEGPGGNPAVVVAQLEGAWAQVEETRASAAQYEQASTDQGQFRPASVTSAKDCKSTRKCSGFSTT